MPYVLRRKHHRVHEQLVLEIFRWPLLVEAIGAGANITRNIGTPEVRRQIAAAMRPDDPQVRELVQDPTVNQVGEKHRRLEWIADDVAERAPGARSEERR